jgi:hypothetical protein
MRRRQFLTGAFVMVAGVALHRHMVAQSPSLRRKSGAAKGWPLPRDVAIGSTRRTRTTPRLMMWSAKGVVDP